MSFRFAFKTSFGHLQDVLARCLACLEKTSSRHLVDVFLPIGNDIMLLIFFFIRVFFHNHSQTTGMKGKGEGISLTPHHHFQPLRRHLDISRAMIDIMNFFKFRKESHYLKFSHCYAPFTKFKINLLQISDLCSNEKRQNKNNFNNVNGGSNISTKQ